MVWLERRSLTNLKTSRGLQGGKIESSKSRTRSACHKRGNNREPSGVPWQSL